MPRSSPAIELAVAALKFARSHTERREESALHPERHTQHAVALVECVSTFAMNCPQEIEPEAQKKLGIFLEMTVGEMIDGDQMSWIGEETKRPVMLRCCADLGTRASAIARAAHSTVTADVLNTAAAQAVGEWQLTAGIVLGPCGFCMKLRNLIERELGGR
jgi:hypothetical protein